ncbi:MAG: ABC transporter ATP-binding protein [Anaerolineales bacterium]
MSQLEIRSVSHWFGGLQALRDVTFSTSDEILGLIGPNGAGKTTLFNIISGFIVPTRGEVLLNGKAIHRLRADQTIRLGLARTFQIVKPFATLTVEENVLAGLGMPYYPKAEALYKIYRTGENLEKIEQMLEKVHLSEYRFSPAAKLPIGLQRRLEIARALATHPKVLLLDEPAAGLVAQEAEELADLIRDLHSQGIHIILIEHNMRFAMNLCQRIVVLAQGEIIAEGVPAEIQNNEKVINAYLGQE